MPHTLPVPPPVRPCPHRCAGHHRPPARPAPISARVTVVLPLSLSSRSRSRFLPAPVPNPCRTRAEPDQGARLRWVPPACPRV